MLKKALNLVAIALLCGIGVQAQEWKEAQSAGYTYKYVEGDPTNTRFYTLPNGLSVILSRETEKPRIQTYFAIKAGSKTDPSTHTGLAHYLEHLLFKGTDKFGTKNYAAEKPLLDKIEQLYEDYGATTLESERKDIYHQIDSLSGEASKIAIANEYDKMMANMGAEGTNAFTSFEQTVYVEDIPANAIDKFLAIQAERFRNPVFRIFHTELEAVYEEKNISMDSDNSKMFESFFKNMFRNHNYGKQTTIGEIEHLKRPSLKEIRKYFETYYVPNNMGLIMAGDFNPDEVIAKVDRAFSYMKAKPVPPYTFDAEKPLMAPVFSEVVGPNPESLFIGYRFPGAATKDARILNLLGQILTNGATGILDLNLVQKQELLGAWAFPYALKDYSVLILQGNPKEGQSLDVVKNLILNEIENLKKGNFDDNLIPAIINNEMKNITKRYESYSDKASILMDNFTSETDWKYQVGYINELKSITKQDIVNFANKYLQNNYVATYKRKGEDPNKIKVEKPVITPIHIEKDIQSDFLVNVNNMPENTINPIWLDYNKDIKRGKVGNNEILAVQNHNNDLFSLQYYYETGKWSSKLLPIAADFINYMGTKSKSSEQVAKDFYNLASEYSINVTDERTYIMLNGLNQNLGKTIALFDDLLTNAKADNDVLESYKARLRKARENAKEDKRNIMRGLVNYARYGADNPYNYVLTDQELDGLTIEMLVAELKKMQQYPHKIIYYGPSTVAEVATSVKNNRKAVAKEIKLPPVKNFTEINQTENSVLFAHFKMVQAELTWLRNGDKYNAKDATVNNMFNQYFGGGMGSVVFQTIRESKALAYSTYAYIAQPTDLVRKTSIQAYVGTQSDKLAEAVAGMKDLLNTMPQSEKNLINAKTGLLKSLATDRITKEGIIYNYLAAKRLGLNTDQRKDIFTNAQNITLNDINTYHNRYMKNQTYTHCVVADQDRVSSEEISKLGKVKKLTLKEIFGY